MSIASNGKHHPPVLTIETLTRLLEIAHAERDRFRDLLARVYRDAYNPAEHSKPPVQDLWREVAAVVDVPTPVTSRFK